MNDLTNTLSNKAFNLDIEEIKNPFFTTTFRNGNEQRVGATFIPFYSVEISYRGLNNDEYAVLKDSFEDNYANTFIFNLNNLATESDLRTTTLALNGSVFVFNDFNFTATATNRLWSGKVVLISSVFFNYTQYQTLNTESSIYNKNITSNTDFVNLLDIASPNAVSLSYSSRLLASNIGYSTRHIKGKDSLKKVWDYSWLLNENDFIALRDFYRQKGSIFGSFGVPSLGIDTNFDLLYVENDYVQDDYIFYDSDTEQLVKARFLNESFSYNKSVNGLYSVNASFIEVN